MSGAIGRSCWRARHGTFRSERWLCACLAAAALAGGARKAAAAPAATRSAPEPDLKVQVLVIGNNQAPLASAGAVTQTLRFADDDAAAFYQLMAEIADSGHLLTVMDRDTEALYPGLVGAARPPTLEELREAVAALARRMEETRRQGSRNALYIFYSGHGSVVEGREPELALLDGGIGHDLLYEEILARLPADYVHLFVDACHAEAVVRPRDSQSQPVSVTSAESESFLVHTTLARFPRVGAIVAASSDTLAHEWDLLGHGVFTYELLSALRGAADVNRDGRIEYSEIYAFLAAANRGVEDPRGRLAIVARPPTIDRHVAVLDLTRFPMTNDARLRDVPAGAGLVQVEDGAGRRIASLRGDRDFVADLLVPAGTIFVRAGEKEARFETRPGQSVSFGSLDFRAPQGRPRGALAESVRRGLFASEFGRGYYQGFIDQAPDFVPVVFAAADLPAVAIAIAAPPQAGVRAGGETARPGYQLGYQLILGGGASNAVAETLGASEALRIGLRPGARRGTTLSLDLTRAASAGVSEQRLTAAVGWLWSARSGPARGWVGAAAGGGAIVQSAGGEPARWTALAEAGPLAGAAVELSARVGVWLEAQLSGLVYRLDGRGAVSLGPSALAGVSLAL